MDPTLRSDRDRDRSSRRTCEPTRRGLSRLAESILAAGIIRPLSLALHQFDELLIPLDDDVELDAVA